ncbi:molybdenum cofactor biosynthesis protein 1B [Colletotrichum tofieldiae]|nr:molybdenum cofactor biosynthesis protein 1B [Colletotrichum tofieldiae]
MVSIASKTPTARVAKAACTVTFSSPLAIRLIRASQVKKGDVLGTARVAGVMAAKRTPDLIPLCHPILLSHVGVEVEPASGSEDETVLNVEATVECEGKTGVEMEAMTAAAAAALTVYDMCKAVDKGMIVGGLRVVLKDGGRAGGGRCRSGPRRAMASWCFAARVAYPPPCLGISVQRC